MSSETGDGILSIETLSLEKKEQNKLIKDVYLALSESHRIYLEHFKESSLKNEIKNFYFHFNKSLKEILKKENQDVLEESKLKIFKFLYSISFDKNESFKEENFDESILAFWKQKDCFWIIVILCDLLDIWFTYKKQELKYFSDCDFEQVDKMTLETILQIVNIYKKNEWLFSYGVLPAWFKLISIRLRTPISYTFKDKKVAIITNWDDQFEFGYSLFSFINHEDIAYWKATYCDLFISCMIDSYLHSFLAPLSSTTFNDVLNLILKNENDWINADDSRLKQLMLKIDHKIKFIQKYIEQKKPDISSSQDFVDQMELNQYAKEYLQSGKPILKLFYFMLQNLDDPLWDIIKPCQIDATKTFFIEIAKARIFYQPYKCKFKSMERFIKLVASSLEIIENDKVRTASFDLVFRHFKPKINDDKKPNYFVLDLPYKEIKILLNHLVDSKKTSNSYQKLVSFVLYNPIEYLDFLIFNATGFNQFLIPVIARMLRSELQTPANYIQCYESRFGQEIALIDVILAKNLKKIKSLENLHQFQELINLVFGKGNHKLNSARKGKQSIPFSPSRLFSSLLFFQPLKTSKSFLPEVLHFLLNNLLSDWKCSNLAWFTFHLYCLANLYINCSDQETQDQYFKVLQIWLKSEMIYQIKLENLKPLLSLLEVNQTDKSKKLQQSLSKWTNQVENGFSIELV